MNKYRVVEKATETMVRDGLHSRSMARFIKKELELKRQADTDSRNRPSAYYVETSDEHPDGAGIYLH